MCNIYSLTKGIHAIRQSLKTVNDVTDGFAPMPAVFPNDFAPVVRLGSGGVYEMQMMRWGFPSPPFSVRRPVTHIRNLDSGYWKPYLIRRAHRCLVPVTSFSELDHSVKPARWTWFAQDEARPLFFFAGIWREWEGDRGTKAAPDVGKHLLFSFLTTDASQDEARVHDKATPVCLFTEAARDEWMKAPWERARELQRPPAPGIIRIVAAGKEDPAPDPS